MILIALKDIRHDLVSTLLNLITLGTIIFAFLLLISLSFTLNIFGGEHGPTRNLLILERDVLSPEESEIPVDLVRTVFQVLGEHIERADPLIFRIMEVENTTVQIRGITPSAWVSTFQLKVVAGEWPVNEDEILVDQILTENPGWNLGNQVTIYGRKFRIAGIAEGSGNAIQTVWLPFAIASELFNQTQTAELMVVNLKPDADAIEAQQVLQAQLSSSGNYEVYFEDALLEKFGAAFQDLRSMSVLLTAIAITAVTLSSHNQAWLATDKRKFSLGILRTIGFHRAAVEGYLLFRALTLNLLAFVLAYLAARVYIELAALENFSYGGARLSLEFAPSMIILGLLLSSGSTLLGTWLSSWKATSSSPAELLDRGKGLSFT